MAKEIASYEEALSFIRDVKVRFLDDDERFQQFQEIIKTVMEGTIPTVIVVWYVNIFLADEPELLKEFQKFTPMNLKQNHVEKIQENGFVESEVIVEEKGLGDDTIQEIPALLPIDLEHHQVVEERNQETDFQESDVVNRTNFRDDTIEEADSQKSEVVEKKGSRKDDIQACLAYVNRVLKGFKDQPDMISKFFDLMGEYRRNLDEKRLKDGLFDLFQFYPEFGIEFLQLTTKEPYPVHEEAMHFSLKKDVLTNPLEDLKNRFEDEMFEIEMTISRINSAIDNTMKFLMACRKGRRTMEVTRYLTGENVKEILKYCKVNLKNYNHPKESAYFVVGKLKVQLEVEKEKRVDIRRNMASEIQKLQNKKRRIS